MDKKMRLLLADFGFAKDFQENVLKTNCGTAVYKSPELYLRKGYRGPPVDVFACGVILYYFLTA
jgi:serine/threonine protein kinase